MNAQEFIATKRDGKKHPQEQINDFISSYTAGDIPDYQAAAWLMAAFLNGLDSDETFWLTRAMIESGSRLDLSSLSGPKGDKHSTGGVGDKTSLLVAPICAACGVTMPMVSGRGLGHTGGTLDKLESIPGFEVGLTVNRFLRVLSENGLALAGQTEQIAPADKKLYALRDATATVASIPLIAASIMSKKLAEGIDALVLDVKTGSGAFMQEEADARELAAAIIAIGRDYGVKTCALITSMDHPLGRCVGNALEVRECLEILRNQASPQSSDLIQVSLALAAELLLLTGVAPDAAGADALARKTLQNGSALAKLKQTIVLQGGDPAVTEDPSLLPQAAVQQAVKAPRSGYLAGCDALAVGKACVLLGAGRRRMEDAVDHAAGVELLHKPGSHVRAGEPVILVHAADGAAFSNVAPILAKSLAILPTPPDLPELIRDKFLS